MHCGACAENCYVNALVATGRRVSVEDVMREVTEDAPYYQTSGGGVTLSGGEPVLQQSCTLDLLGALKAAGIHTVVQTAGNYPFILLKPMLPYIDIVMYDVKGMSGHIYSEYIFGDRTRMLDNLKLLDDITDKPIIVRTPVIEGVNATRDEIEEIARFIKPLKNLESYRLIPYHGLGRAKYEALDSSYKNTFATPSPATIASLESAAAKYAPVYNLEKGFI
jgi:pyruvate formate lyase activating enzyme